MYYVLGMDVYQHTTYIGDSDYLALEIYIIWVGIFRLVPLGFVGTAMY